ncbi:MAG: GNAT family N-acetyltransferase [Paludibacteraceae bacterium]|nr:GNAT family N-acetyltransferase [Paludibacteraceae bacterium]
MEISRAGIGDIDGILELLLQVNNVHAEGRPDIFVKDKRKYERGELSLLLNDDDRPVFVGKDEQGTVVGYCFCVVERIGGGNQVARTTLYIDDLCVRAESRQSHIGTELYNYALGFAKSIGCYNVTLNVWECNESARRFYDKLGLKPFKTSMEVILK